ncbi:protein kinase family protein [Natronomonas salina]|uniref:lipopolysaccharide kinase InaA family protein n=1 Tax=Natronomonas salina TaxID=1710540 RepID=UPI0015B5C924|nr:lipopolysaccharide kinase InaA family protein [Natronomonas salina]QLD88456.1 protein kinase family protein [Natronomonas salina]
MAFRRFLRASVPQSRLEAVAEEVARRYGGSSASLECLDADNWLSVPCVVDDRWFVKIIADQHTLVHGLLTTGRNIGAFSSGTEGFFERFSTPVEMAEHELAATRRMRELGVSAPEPVEAFEHDGLGVLVLEYLPDFRALDELPPADVERFAPDLFENLSRMHDAGIAHGDLRAENVLVAPNRAGEQTLFFIDATRVRDGAIEDATAYDLACALASLAPHIGAAAAVAAALEHYSLEELLAARRFLDFVNMRPDHDFDNARVKGEIEKVAT